MNNKIATLCLLLGASLFLSGCDQLQQAFIDHCAAVSAERTAQRA